MCVCLSINGRANSSESWPIYCVIMRFSMQFNSEIHLSLFIWIGFGCSGKVALLFGPSSVRLPQLGACFGTRQTGARATIKIKTRAFNCVMRGASSIVSNGRPWSFALIFWIVFRRRTFAGSPASRLARRPRAEGARCGRVQMNGAANCGAAHLAPAARNDVGRPPA